MPLSAPPFLAQKQREEDEAVLAQIAAEFGDSGHRNEPSRRKSFVKGGPPPGSHLPFHVVH